MKSKEPQSSGSSSVLQEISRRTVDCLARMRFVGLKSCTEATTLLPEWCNNCLLRHAQAEIEGLQRTVRSIAAMLGWGNVPPRETLEADIRALKARVEAAEARAEAAEARFDFRAHLQRQREWSGQTFGPGPRTHGVIDHIRKELREIESDPSDISEWIDVTILALDGAWRAGFMPEQIIAALVAKQAKNESRLWPDWRTADPNKAIEHERALASPVRDAAEPQQEQDLGLLGTATGADSRHPPSTPRG